MPPRYEHPQHVRKLQKHVWVAKEPSMVPGASQSALRQAMALEGVPATDYNDLLWIMAQESEGKLNGRNARSTARGLFQLLKPHYALNPNGVSSFGNATEECQGGIRYIVGRYSTAGAARRFWQIHHWY